MLGRTNNYATLNGGATSPVTIKAYAKPVFGNTLAHGYRKSKTLHALEAAAQCLGYADIHKPTQRQAALLNGVSVAYVQYAITAIKSGQAADVKAGCITLVEAAAKARPPALPKPVDLVAAVASASDAELTAIGHALGVAKVWDVLIQPNI